MSNNHADQSPVDRPLPDDLVQCESILAHMSLPRSRLQRDELIYRVGWAAAEVHAQSVTGQGVEPSRSSPGTGGRSTLAWSVASAAIAASLAVVITLRIQPAVDAPANSPADAVVDLSRAEDPAKDRERKPPSADLAQLTRGGINKGTEVGWTASLLIMRDRALRQQLDDRWIVSEGSFGGSLANDAASLQPRTSREMLREFLPGPSAQEKTDRDSMRQRLRWPWQTIRWGDTT